MFECEIVRFQEIQWADIEVSLLKKVVRKVYYVIASAVVFWQWGLVKVGSKSNLFSLAASLLSLRVSALPPTPAQQFHPLQRLRKLFFTIKIIV